MERMNARDFYNAVVLPDLFAGLDRAFPEFGWVRKGGKWETGKAITPATRDLYGDPGRACCKPESPYQFIVAGREAVSWTRYMAGGVGEPRGADFVRAVVGICEILGIDAAPLTREPVSNAERARWAAQAAERREEAERIAAMAERDAAADRERKIAEARAAVGDVAAQVRDGRDQEPIARYLKQRGRTRANFPGGVWPDGAIYGAVRVGKRKHTAIVVPALDAAWEVVGCQRIFIDELGKPAPVKVDAGPVRKAALGSLNGSAARIGRGFPDGVLVLCEGWETGVAIHEATGWTVWPCISTAGLRTVEIGDADLAEISVVIVAGDLDRQHEPPRGRPFRPGQEAARDAADRVRDLYEKPCAVALPAHAFAPGMVTADELPAGDAKSVDWENIANGMGPGVVRDRMGLSRAAATVVPQGRLPWEPDPSDPARPGPGSPDPAPAEDRSKLRRAKDGGGWEKWHGGAQRWVAWCPEDRIWLEPTGPVLPASNLDAAHEYLLAKHAPAKIGRGGGGLGLLSVGGRAYRHTGTRWVEYADAPVEVIRGEVRRYFAGHCKPKTTRAKEPVTHFVPANVSKSEVESIASAAVDEVRTLTPHDDFQAQFWCRANLAAEGGALRVLTEHAAWDRRVERPSELGLPPPDAVIPLRNGLFDLDAWRRDHTISLMPHTPLLFNTGVVEAELPVAEARAALGAGGIDGLADYARTLCPEWLAFLARLFKNPDPDAATVTIRELHKVIGNYLTTEMRHHQANIVFMIGPPGAGKSVLTSVIEALLGPSNCVPSTVSQLDGQFHLRSWIGKRLAIFPDMDISGRVDKKKIVELLKMIATGDPMTIDRKHLDEIPNFRLTTRMLVAANQMPSLPDPSNSLERRSFSFEFRNPIPREEMDTGLADRLRAPRSLAGVLLLAMIGQIDLEEEGFVQPAWSAGPLEDLRAQGSKYADFIEIALELNGEGTWLANQELRAAFHAYAEAEGSNYTPDAAKLVSEIRPLLIQAGWISRGRTKKDGRYGYEGVALTDAGRAMLGNEAAGVGEYAGAGFLPDP